MQEFLAALKDKPKLTFASAGTRHARLFRRRSLEAALRCQFDPRPYKGAGPALADVIGNHVDFYFPGFPAAAPHVKGGNLKSWRCPRRSARRSRRRSRPWPRSPGSRTTISRSGPGFFAPRGTPQPIIDKLNKAINGVLAQPDVKAKLETAGAIVQPMSVAQVKAFVQAESRKYLTVIKETGASARVMRSGPVGWHLLSSCIDRLHRRGSVRSPRFPGLFALT